MTFGSPTRNWGLSVISLYGDTSHTWFRVPGPFTFQRATLKSWEWPGLRGYTIHVLCTLICIQSIYMYMRYSPSSRYSISSLAYSRSTSEVLHHILCCSHHWTLHIRDLCKVGGEVFGCTFMYTLFMIHVLRITGVAPACCHSDQHMYVQVTMNSYSF